MIELVLGGARSGKSHYAQQLANDSELKVIYVATAEAGDEEMRDRIKRHQAERPSHWLLVEEPLSLAGALKEHAAATQCVLVDCLTLWLSNLLGLQDEDEFHYQRDTFIRLLPALPGRIILVSNETGLGIVPMGALTRRYTDESGLLHQELARLCDRVTFMVAGLPQQIK